MKTEQFFRRISNVGIATGGVKCSRNRMDSEKSPADRISVKTRYFIEEIMADLSSSSSGKSTGEPGQDSIPPASPNV